MAKGLFREGIKETLAKGTGRQEALSRPLPADAETQDLEVVNDSAQGRLSLGNVLMTHILGTHIRNLEDQANVKECMKGRIGAGRPERNVWCWCQQLPQ